MADHQRVIEFLRDVRQGGPGPGSGLHAITPEIQQMAADYAALCVQANERLRQCTTFLQQGLRSEAIHLADETPNLLDLVAQLDLPDPLVWAEFCQNNGLPVPPPLQLERAATLNEAYAQDQPLEHLLSQHRLLALSRAPVGERLSVMRKIAQFDTSSPNWEKDIRTFEAARLKELPSTFYTAVKNRDQRTIAALMDEVNQQKWLEPAPADLATSIAEAYFRMQRAGVEEELRLLIEPLREAFAARSVQECTALVQRWKNVMGSAGVTNVAPELMEEIKPVVAFINEQARRDGLERRFKEACREFTVLLDADAPDVQLEAGYAKLKEFREDIPEDLTTRLMDRKAGRRKHEDRRHRMRLMFIATAAAAGIIIALVVIYLVTSASTAEHWATELRRAVDQRSKAGMDQAQARLDELQKSNPGVLHEPKVAAAVNDLRLEQSDYTRDAQSLQSLIAGLRSAQEAATASAARANPTMDETRSAAGALQKTVNEAATVAEKLAWADPDKTLESALAGARSVLASMRERVLAGLRAEVANISSSLDALPANPATPEGAVESRKQLAALGTRVSALRDMPLLDEESTIAIAGLNDRISKMRQGAELSGDVAGELQVLRAHASSAADLGAALEAYIRRFPNDPRTPDFQSALRRIGPAESLDAWQQLVSTFGSSLAAGNASATQKRLDAITAFLAGHPDMPKAGEALQYADYLRKAAEALSDKGPWQNTFAELLTNPLLSELSYLEVSDGRRFYTLGDIKRIDRSINNQKSVSFQALDIKDPTKRVAVTIDPPLSVSSAPIPAPHTRAVTDIADSLKLIDDRNWDTYGIDLADRLARNDKMDVVVTAILLQRALHTESNVASWGVGDTYERALAELARQTPDQLQWIDPTRISDGTRKAIRQIVDAIPPAPAVRQKLAAARTVLFKSVVLNSPTIGVLLRDNAGAWALSTRASASEGSLVWAVLPGTTAARPAATLPPGTSPATALFNDAAPALASSASGGLVQVGKAVAARFVLDEGALRNSPQGCIVYITPP